jgi:hypothetical protein
MVVERTAQEG